MRKKRKSNKKGLKEWGRAIVLALFLAIVVKGFVIQSYVVSTQTMEKTIMAGDYIWVNKLKYGARLPITLLSVPFFSNLYTDIVKLPYMRLLGSGEVERNDFLVFNYPTSFDTPIDKKRVLIKRCVGLPGDTIHIHDKELFVNKKLNSEKENTLFSYRLVTDGSLLNETFTYKYDITTGGMVSDIGIYDFPLKKSQVAEIKANEPQIRYIREMKDFRGENTKGIFPEGRKYNYNKDFFGPVVVPFKGMEITLNGKTLEKYRILIENYEKNEVIVRNNQIYINGLATDSYIVKNNYYFVLDDNRDYAKDSRYFGFLPENHIVGNAIRVWFSVNKNQENVRWSRIFKKLDN